jgi:hypothetical protein
VSRAHPRTLRSPRLVGVRPVRWFPGASGAERFAFGAGPEWTARKKRRGPRGLASSDPEGCTHAEFNTKLASGVAVAAPYTGVRVAR